MRNILDDLNPCDCPRCGQHESYGCSCTRIEQLEAERDALQAKLDRAESALSDACDALDLANSLLRQEPVHYAIPLTNQFNARHAAAERGRDTLAELKEQNHDT